MKGFLGPKGLNEPLLNSSDSLVISSPTSKKLVLEPSDDGGSVKSASTTNDEKKIAMDHIQIDLKKSIEYYLDAAKHGSANAQCNIAIHLMRRGQLETALSWFKQAVDQNDAYLRYSRYFCEAENYDHDHNNRIDRSVLSIPYASDKVFLPFSDLKTSSSMYEQSFIWVRKLANKKRIIWLNNELAEMFYKAYNRFSDRYENSPKDEDSLIDALTTAYVLKTYAGNSIQEITEKIKKKWPIFDNLKDNCLFNEIKEMQSYRILYDDDNLKKIISKFLYGRYTFSNLDILDETVVYGAGFNNRDLYVSDGVEKLEPLLFEYFPSDLQPYVREHYVRIKKFIKDFYEGWFSSSIENKTKIIDMFLTIGRLPWYFYLRDYAIQIFLEKDSHDIIDEYIRLSTTQSGVSYSGSHMYSNINTLLLLLRKEMIVILNNHPDTMLNLCKIIDSTVYQEKFKLKRKKFLDRNRNEKMGTVILSFYSLIMIFIKLDPINQKNLLSNFIDKSAENYSHFKVTLLFSAFCSAGESPWFVDICKEKLESDIVRRVIVNHFKNIKVINLLALKKEFAQFLKMNYEEKNSKISKMDQKYEDVDSKNFYSLKNVYIPGDSQQMKIIVEDLQSMKSEEKMLGIDPKKIEQLTNFSSEILKTQKEQQEQINEIHKIMGQQRPQLKKWLDYIRKDEKLNQYYEFLSQHLMQAAIAAIAIGSNKLDVAAGKAGWAFKGLGKIANSIPIIGPAIALLTEPLQVADRVNQVRNISNIARLFKNDVLMARWVISQFAIELTISKQDEICGRCTSPVGLKEKIEHYWKRLKTASKGKYFAIFTKENLNETTHLAIYDVAVVVDAVESNKIIREEEIFYLSQNEQELIMRLLSIFSLSDKREPRQLVDAKQLPGPSVEDLLTVVKSEAYKRTAKFDNFVRVKLGQIENSIRIQYGPKLNHQLENIQAYFSAKLALFLLKCYAIAAGTMERAAAAVPAIKVINCEIPDVKVEKYRLIDLNHQRLLELMQLVLNFAEIKEKLGPYILIKESEKIFESIVRIANETARIVISYYHQPLARLSKEDLVMVTDVAICRILSHLHKDAIVGQDIIVCLRHGCMSPNSAVSATLKQGYNEVDSKEQWKVHELFEQIGVCTPTNFYFHSSQPFYQYGYCEITDDEFNDFNIQSNNQYIEDRHKNYEKHIQSNSLLSPQNLESLDLIPFGNKEQKYNSNLQEQVNELSKQVKHLTKQNQTVLSVLNQLIRIPSIYHHLIKTGDEEKEFLSSSSSSVSSSSSAVPSLSSLPVGTQLKIPGDGSCLFWSVALGVLIPVLDHEKGYRSAFNQLFVLDQKGIEDNNLFDKFSEGLKNRVQAFLSSNDTTLINKQGDHDPLYNLINSYLRQKVANYIDNHLLEFKGFITEDDYVAKLREETFWGGDIEIRAIFKLLGENYRLVVENTQINLGDQNKPTIHLIYTNVRGKADGTKNHYNLRIENYTNEHQRQRSHQKPSISPLTSPSSSSTFASNSSSGSTISSQIPSTSTTLASQYSPRLVGSPPASISSSSSNSSSSTTGFQQKK